jgi:hypothetical protein
MLKKVPERRSGLRPSEKEIPEWRSSAFLHKTHLLLCEISSSHGGEYDVQSCLLGYTAV